MSTYKKLKAIAIGFVAGLSTLLSAVNTQHTEIKAGLCPFTLYAEGAVRYYYDLNDKVTEISYINPYGEQYATQKFIYDEYGTVDTRALEESRSFWFSRYTNFHYTYNDYDNRLSESQICGFKKRKINYSYDLFGNVETIQASEGYSFLTNKECAAMRYNGPNDNITVCSFYDRYGHLFLQHQWEYDIGGRLICKRIFDGQLRLISKVEYAYNVSTNTDQETSYDSSGNMISFTYVFKDASNRVYERQVRSHDGKIMGLIRYDYTSDNQLASIIDTDASGNIVGILQVQFDNYNRPFLYSFRYSDFELAQERLKGALSLPGNDI